ncbi:hypothetical protein TIFTF001_015536 [Ficus carica]|uniref:KIB1-4 beta-propeller domain-containing protein n=1 Tax=Ficus carica TaxID=3494 RepID=A0AA88A7E0_FICCA|nr:hypothetical protein TIFTF001_015536 [Ficus carica]
MRHHEVPMLLVPSEMKEIVYGACIISWIRNSLRIRHYFRGLVDALVARQKDGYSTDYPESYVFKITTFTPDPIAYMNDVICVAIFGFSRELAYIRPATENKWIRVTGTKHFSFHDVVSYNNQFYALTREGMRQLNLNVDAVMKSGFGFVGIGAIICGSHGVMVACLAKRLIGFVSSHVASVYLLIREGL